jgi:hypothetical protein
MANVKWLRVTAMVLLVLGAILLIVGGVLYQIYGQMKTDSIYEVI